MNKVGLIISLVLSSVFFLIVYFNRNKKEDEISKKKAKGKIINAEYSGFSDILYTIEISEGRNVIKAKSIHYARQYKKLKKDTLIDVAYYSTKRGNIEAIILDNELVPCKKNDNSFILVLAIFFLLMAMGFLGTVIAKYFEGNNSLTIFMFIVVIIIILFLIPPIFIGLNVIKKGNIVKATIIKKELIETKSSDISTRKSIRKQFNIGVKFKGMILEGLFVIDSYTENLKVGDKINIRVYKNNFLLEDQDIEKRNNK